MELGKSIHKPLSEIEVMLEANRCLYCYDAPCMNACPTHIDVASFIQKISTGNVKGSAHTIMEANAMGASCARVCPTEELCEGACVYNEAGDSPIRIGDLQRYAIDYVAERDIPTLRARARHRQARRDYRRRPGRASQRRAICAASAMRSRFSKPKTNSAA